jgi:hypothetical protein
MGTHWELEREHVGNKGKKKKNSSPPSPQNLKKIKLGHFPNMLSLPIGLHEIFYFQNCLSPFLAWANNTPKYKLGVLIDGVH